MDGERYQDCYEPYPDDDGCEEAERLHADATTEARLFRESEERAAFESWLDQLDRGRVAELDLSVAPF